MTAGQKRVSRPRKLLAKCLALGAATAVLLTAPFVLADRTQIQPGWNIFTTDQDIEIGQRVAIQTEARLPMLMDRKVNSYLTSLGRRLTRYAPGAKYPYEFHVVNSHEVNSFALPGGVIFIYRGIIEEAGDESQLAGVISHEISHVALRHGTNQASKAEMSTGVLGILGSVVVGNGVGDVVNKAGEDIATSSYLLKYSKTAETQADVLGTQMLYDAGYDPRAMGQFFENIESESKHGKFADFFSNHPVPERRIERIDKEIDNMGGMPKDYQSDSEEFREIRRYILTLPAPPPENGKRTIQSAQIRMEPRPLSRGTGSASTPLPPDMRVYSAESFEIGYPLGWKASADGDTVSIVPPNGLVKHADGTSATAYGVTARIFVPQAAQNVRPSRDPSSPANAQALSDATDQLMLYLQQTRPNMKVTSLREDIQVDGQPALSFKLTDDSPVGGREKDWLVVALRPQGGVLYFLAAAPADAYADYDAAFQKIISTVGLNQ